MTETPRVDAKVFSIPLAGGNHNVVFADVARQLERDLAERTEALKEANKSNEALIDDAVKDGETIVGLTDALKASEQSEQETAERVRERCAKVCDDTAEEVARMQQPSNEAMGRVRAHRNDATAIRTLDLKE